MNEQTREEIDKAASLLGMSSEDAVAKFESICEENGLSPDAPIALGLWRSYAAQQRRAQGTAPKQNNQLAKKAFGFFISLDAPRDMMSWNRNRAKEEYKRNADAALEKGVIATATRTDDGKWNILRVFKGEYQNRIVNNLPEGAEELDNGETVIPLDATEKYMNGGTNKNFGKPLPKEQYRRTGIFFGRVGDDTENKSYFFSYKNEGCMEFSPKCFEFLHMMVIKNDNGTDIYGFTDVTKASLIMNADLDPENSDYRDVSNFDYTDCLTEWFADKIAPLVDLNSKHINNLTLPSKERYVITDGTVCNMNMTAFANGNRIVNITDLTAEFNYDDGNNMTTCWVPAHIDIDFGIGSNIIVIGRTSQRNTEEGPEPVTMNVSGMYVVERCGTPVEIESAEENDFDWF